MEHITNQAILRGSLLNLPEVKDLAAYRQEMYAGWLNFKLGETR